MVNAVIGVGIVALPSAFANIGLPSHGRWSHFQAALFVLYGESRMKSTGAHENDVTALG